MGTSMTWTHNGVKWVIGWLVGKKAAGWVTLIMTRMNSAVSRLWAVRFIAKKWSMVHGSWLEDAWWLVGWFMVHGPWLEDD